VSVARFAGAVAAGVIAAACSRPDDTLRIALETAGAPPAVVRVSGLSERELAALQAARMTDDTWPRLLRVAVAGGPADQPTVVGRYAVTASGLEFTPRFGFDPGRRYDVTLDPSRLPEPRASPPVTVTVSLPAATASRAAAVVRMLPSADVLPENTLRVYLEFSAPMSRASGRDFMRLLDQSGRDVPDALLAIDVDLWNADYTRYTAFFDPGRVKQGIQPNERMGRALVAGRTYTIEVDRRWPDATGQPLEAAFTRTFRAGPAVLTAISLGEWRVEPARAGTRDPLVVTFPRPLDHGLLSRALGIARERATLDGDATIGPLETSWRFTPREPWRAGPHDLVVLGSLEDPAGNRIGRPFDLDRLNPQTDRTAEAERHTVPFVVR
jgi:hypothetical protein